MKPGPLVSRFTNTNVTEPVPLKYVKLATEYPWIGLMRICFFFYSAYALLLAGVLYFVSCTVNPILYNVMSRRFRQAFVETICRARRDRDTQYATHMQLVHAPAVRRARRSISSEMTPSPHHHHHDSQHQQQLLMSSVYVHDAAKTTVQQ